MADQPPREAQQVPAPLLAERDGADSDQLQLVFKASARIKIENRDGEALFVESARERQQVSLRSAVIERAYEEHESCHRLVKTNWLLPSPPPQVTSLSSVKPLSR